MTTDKLVKRLEEFLKGEPHTVMAFGQVVQVVSNTLLESETFKVIRKERKPEAPVRVRPKPPMITVAEYEQTCTPEFLRGEQWRSQQFLAECSEEFLLHLFDFPFKQRNKADERLILDAEIVHRDRYEKFDGSGYPK